MDDNANALPAKVADSGEQTRDLLQELIDSAYETALTPAQYDRFMDNWNAYMGGLLAGVREGVDEIPALTAAVDDPAVARHFARASAILQRMVVTERPATAEAVAGSDERAAIVFSPTGRMLAANAAARAEFGERIDAADLADRMEAGGVARLREGLQHIQRIGLAAAPVVLRLSRQDGERDYFVLTPVQVQAVDTPCGVLRALQLNWTREFETIVRETFALTARETAIVRDLARGATLERVAETGGAALATVRTQMKSIYAKTGVTSQPALVRLVTGLSAIVAPAAVEGEETFETGEPVALTLADGRRMQLHIHGPTGGRPVVFVHGMLDGVGVPRAVGQLLRERNIRLIAPVRASFGRSDPQRDRKRAPENFALDLGQVLEKLALPRVPVIGHLAGSVYAIAAAAMLPERISAVMAISGGIPIRTRLQFQMMTPRQRTVAITARYLPHLLPLILNAGIAQIRSGGARSFMDALYRNAPLDHAIASRDDIFPLVRDGYLFTVAQGPDAFATDAAHVTRDWSDYMARVRQPVTYVHGFHDPVVRIATVRQFANDWPNVRLIERADAGQLVFYQMPEFVFDCLEQVIGSNVAAAGGA